MGREESADQRPGHRREAENGPEEPVVPAALARRDDVADRRLGADHQTAAAQALDRPEDDQLAIRARPPSTEPTRKTTTRR